MIEKLKKNMNEWHYHSLAVTILAIITILKYEEVVLSIILITISTVLNGIGALYNQNKKIQELKKEQRYLLFYSGKTEVCGMDFLTREEIDRLLEIKEKEDKALAKIKKELYENKI